MDEREKVMTPVAGTDAREATREIPEDIYDRDDIVEAGQMIIDDGKEWGKRVYAGEVWTAMAQQYNSTIDRETTRELSDEVLGAIEARARAAKSSGVDRNWACLHADELLALVAMARRAKP